MINNNKEYGLGKICSNRLVDNTINSAPMTAVIIVI